MPLLAALAFHLNSLGISQTFSRGNVIEIRGARMRFVNTTNGYNEKHGKLLNAKCRLSKKGWHRRFLRSKCARQPQKSREQPVRRGTQRNAGAWRKQRLVIASLLHH
jgi:hypothetical protein